MKLLWLITALLSPAIAFGQGISYLGLCNPSWNCSATMATWKGNLPIVTGWIENTFGKTCECGDKILQSERDKTIRVHLANGPCMRNGRCGRYEVFAGFTIAQANKDIKQPNSIIRRRFFNVLKRFKARLSKSQGALKCYVSPCLECDLDETSRRLLLSSVSRHLPGCNVVDNPHRRHCIRGYTCEGHGSHPRVSAPCIVDLDGLDGRVVDRKKFVEHYKHCDITYYWELWMNCISGSFVDPRLRACDHSRVMYKRMRTILCQYFYPSSDIC